MMKEMAWARNPMLPRLKDRDHKGTVYFKLLKFFNEVYILNPCNVISCWIQ